MTTTAGAGRPAEHAAARPPAPSTPAPSWATLLVLLTDITPAPRPC